MRDSFSFHFRRRFAPRRAGVPTLDRENAAVPFEDFDVGVGDRLEIDVDRRAGRQAEPLEVDGDEVAARRPGRR